MAKKVCSIFFHSVCRFRNALLSLALVSLAASAYAAIGIDANTSSDQNRASTTVSSARFSTSSANELLLAFIATDYLSGANTTVTGVSGGGLTWTLVIRTNAQSGTSEIWRAFSPVPLSNITVTATLSQSIVSSLTVMSFSGVDTTGTSGSGAIGAVGSGHSRSGAPSATLVTTRNNSWVFGVGNDYDNPIARTPAAGQTVAHQYLTPTGDTYWVQMQNTPTAVSGTMVSINDIAPTSDQYNLSICEILPATTGGTGGGSSTYSLAGTISPSSAGNGATLTLTGAASSTVTANSSGQYTFSNLPNGAYTVTPSKTGYAFSPGSQTANINGSNVSGVDFTATAITSGTVSGTVSPSASGSGTILILSGAPSGYATANGSGNYSFTNLPPGGYTITPFKTGFTFSPPSWTVPYNGTNGSGINFTAQALTPLTVNAPDLGDIIPPAQISIVGAGASRQFQYTHDTFNGGTGPLEIQPVYNSASGNYQGFQHIYSFSSSSGWTLRQTIPIAGAFIFDPDHGHFHFPFATYGLYAANADGTIGSLVVSSTKTGFCIDDSFMYDSWLPNAGAFGNWGSCSDPTTLRGLSVGAVDEYDQTDEGQSIPIPNLPDGTYWLRAVVDPNNYLTESDKSNNETDVKLTITGNTVQVVELLKPVLAPPPAITLTSPSNGAVLSGAIQLAATTPVTGGSGVTFLLDGVPFGTVTTTPFVLSWDTTTALNGSHWLAAQITDSTGRTGTSSVAAVTVNNSNTAPPAVEITSPTAGATVNSVITITATAASQSGVPAVQFYIDGVALGSPVTAPPYMTFWNTEAESAGSHVITATATDSTGLSGTSAPIQVTVDNSHPPNPIGIDATVYRDSNGSMTTPAFSTTTASDLLVAFVAYDGPSTSPQTAVVTGAGLSWTLLKRSNAQSGTAEIWAAKATDLLANVSVTSQPGIGSYHGSLTVLAFTNASGPGIVGQASAPSGAPDIYLPGISAGNWVFAVGNDWDNAIARTPVSGQVLIHQRVDTQIGDTYWVQATTTPSTANSLVDIHDTAPTSDRWDYAAVEIVATRQ